MAIECQLTDSLQPLELFGTLIGALCHDIDHPGVTNSFIIAANGDLALTYNDVAVLENHHAAVTWQVSHRARCTAADRRCCPRCFCLHMFAARPFR
jgi:hypothetical protein